MRVCAGLQSSARQRAGGARRHALLGALALALALAIVARGARAQNPAPPAGAPPDTASRRPVVIGTLADVRRRDSALLAPRSGNVLLRSASASGSLAAGPRSGIRPLAPDVRAEWNQALPFSLNDGSLWAGRGWSTIVRGGVDARLGRVRILLMPEVAASQNLDFDVRPARRAGRGELAWPWSDGRSDIDLPSRFGTERWRVLSPGQSALTVDVGPLAFGVATENAWWGPGVRNALVLSNTAEGFPHALARTRAPLRTPLGAVEARWQTGVLTPSLFSDSAPPRRWRAMSAVAATLSPGGAPGLTLGFARAVVAEIERPGAAASHALDALARWSATPADSGRRPATDQIASLFFHWSLAPARTEVYAEWARQGRPRSVRELLVAPHEGGALTIGLRSAPRVRRSGRAYLRVQLEATSVEQSIAFRDRPTPPPFYTGLAARDGFTHRGQLLGAAIGPGASSQWVSTDWVGGDAEVGVFAGRIRWNNDALYAQENANFFRHDVSALAGLRVARRTRLADLTAEGGWARRYNYLFQNGFANPGGRRTVDLTNLSARLSVTPR